MKVAAQFVLNYLKNEVGEQLKKSGLRIFENFKSALWEEVKKELKGVARKAIEDVETYCDSLYASKREEAIINRVMKQIKLPIILRPFKGIIKNMLKNKIEEFVKNTISKSKEFLA